MTRPAGVEWRYAPRRKVVHALEPPIGTRAICGTEVFGSALWMGTGTQEEYETAAALPMCRRCGDKLGIEFDD